MTKDERFLLELYHLKNSGASPVDPKELSQQLGHSERLTKNIIQGLAKANLIKKVGSLIEITPSGSELARELLT